MNIGETAIINFGKGAWYPRGSARLRQSLMDVRYPGHVYGWSDENALNCPPHEKVPYAFKVAAFHAAARAGHKLILWCDSAVFAIKPVDPIFEQIERDGYIFFASGFYCGQWTSDICLQQMKVTREDAWKMPMYMACCMGLDLTKPRSQDFLARLTEHAMDWKCFPGDWRNDRGQVSKDPRCEGHRHDQSVGSILSNQMGMVPHTIGHDTFFHYYNNAAGIPYRYGQANDMTGIKESVLFLTQGM